MQLTRWTFINREFEPASRPSKREWCQLIESLAVPGKVIAGTPYIDAARFAGATTLDSPAANDDLDAPDLLG
ncbi:MAG: hypothetical protein M0Q49_01800 [Porticoccaceae bacterium]|nr:hypothetical protein [Porticoccaceae bacterium]